MEGSAHLNKQTLMSDKILPPVTMQPLTHFFSPKSYTKEGDIFICLPQPVHDIVTLSFMFPGFDLYTCMGDVQTRHTQRLLTLVLFRTAVSPVLGTERRSTKRFTQTNPEAAHLRRSTPHPKTDVSKNLLALR